MKYFLLFFLAITMARADTPISQLPLGAAATTHVNDSFPYVDAQLSATKRLTLWDLIHLPPMVSTFAPKNNPVFTGTVTAPLFVGNLNGNALGFTGSLAGDVKGNQNVTVLVSTGVVPGAYTNANITVDGKGRILAAANGTGGGSGGGGGSVGFTLEDAVVPYRNIAGTRYQGAAAILSSVNISMINSGTSGFTVVQLNLYRSGILNQTATAAIAAASGNPNSAVASLSSPLIIAVGDLISVDVVSIPTGSPESLTVEFPSSGGGGGGGGGSAAARTTNTVSINFGIPNLTVDYLLNVDSSAGNISISLPSPSLSNGFCASVKHLSTMNDIVITPAAGMIDGLATDTLNVQNEVHKYCAVGSNWFIY